MRRTISWPQRVWIVVAVFAVVTLLRSRSVGIPIRDPHGAILVSRLAVTAVLLVLLALVDAAWRARPGGWTAAATRDRLRSKWTRRRILLATSTLLAYHLVYLCYHNLKSWDVFNRPRDAMLLSWDRWLFVGHSPAVLLHDLLGQHLAAYVLMVVYEAFSTVLAVAVVAAVVFAERIRHGAVFVTAGIWVWILGVGSYYLIPSLGPFQSAPGEFAGLPHLMIQDTQAKYMGQRAFLLAHPHASGAFAQVSAFASLHVALSTLILLGAWYYGLRRTTWILAVYVGATMIATVYLGWHFAVDDVAGVLIAVSGLWLGRRTIYPGGRGEPVHGRSVRGDQLETAPANGPTGADSESYEGIG